MRLHSEAQAQSYQPSNPIEGPLGRPNGKLAAMETPYVVRTHASAQTHKELPCWTFSHPIRTNNAPILASAEKVNNERHAELEFSNNLSSSVAYRSGYGLRCDTIENIVNTNSPDIENSSYTLHGFLGTFHCVLYQSFKMKTVTISIAPNTFSFGMYSWFPLYFPLREPLIVPPDSMIRCNMWRKSDSTDSSYQGGSVWYEWHAEVIDTSSNNVISSSCLHNPRGRSSKILL